VSWEYMNGHLDLQGQVRGRPLHQRSTGQPRHIYRNDNRKGRREDRQRSSSANSIMYYTASEDASDCEGDSDVSTDRPERRDYSDGSRRSDRLRQIKKTHGRHRYVEETTDNDDHREYEEDIESSYIEMETTPTPTPTTNDGTCGSA